MKNVIVAGVAALALVACGAKEEVVAPEAAPAVEEAAPVEAAPAEAVAAEAAPAEAAVVEAAPAEAAK